MLRNYFKTAFRNLLKNKTFSALNIVGLSVGISAAALIMLWVENEMSYDNFIPNKEHIYQLLENQKYDAKTYTFSAQPGPLAAALKQEVPEIKDATRLYWGAHSLFTLGDKEIYEDGNFADPSFFDIFSLPFIEGDPKTAFDDIYSVVISEKMEKKFFPNNSALGKAIKVQNDKEYTITGVFKDVPSNASIQFEWLAPFKILEEKNPWMKGWGTNGLQIFVSLQPTADPEQVDKKLYGFVQTKDSSAVEHPFLFAVNDWRLRNNFEEGIQTGGRIEYVRLFSLIALIILIIACINFMNLATARSEQRAREVGVRKVMGAKKGMLVRQFFGESFFMAFISIIVALLILVLALPSFNTLVGKQLSLQLLNPVHIAGLLGIGLVCGLLAGSYPSFYLSSFNPIHVLKGNKTGSRGNAALIRKGLVVSQFVISIVLIVSTIIIYQQIQHVKTRQLGYDKDRVAYMNVTGQLGDHFDFIRQDLLNSGAVENAALGNSRVLDFGSQSDGPKWEGKDPNSKMLITVENVSPQYISTLGMQLKSGRQFYENNLSDTSSIIINETLASLMGTADPVGKMITIENQSWTIVGVVKDFVYNNMYAKPDPLIFFDQPANPNYFFIRLKNNADLSDATAKVETVLKKDNPGYPVDYKFLDAEFDKLFRSEMLIGSLSRLFAILTIFITCLGLFGLAAYTAERRTKEIGIRKVLGASISNVVALLSKDFLRLVGIAALIAFPIAWWIMSHWLQDYAYRITINFWVFLIAGLAALIIALFTVSFQAIKAAVMNPVRSLRTE